LIEDEPRPSLPALILVAVVILVPFVLFVGGGIHAIEALGPGLIAVALFFAAVAAAYWLVRRWLRRRLLAPPPPPGGSFWSDRR
jgi:hypothetical protein